MGWLSSEVVPVFLSASHQVVAHFEDRINVPVPVTGVPGGTGN